MELPKTFVNGFHDINDFIIMDHKPLGNTDLTVSTISLGCCQLGPVYQTDKEPEAVETVIQAIKKGINYIDIAPWYGFGKAEIVLGKALKQIPRNSYYIATKVGRYHPTYDQMFDFSAQRTLDSVDESLQKLGIEYIDLIQVHDLEFAPSPEIILNETLPALQKIVEQGKARYIGITGYSLKALKEIISRSTVKIDVVLTYSRYNLFDQSLLEYISYFEEKKLGVINAAYLGMGLLAPINLPTWHCATQELKDVCVEAKNFCQKRGVSISRLASNYALRFQKVSTHLVGFCTLDLLAENLRVVTEPLSQFEEDTLQQIIENYFSKLETTHWEGVEVQKYNRKLEEIQKATKI